MITESLKQIYQRDLDKLKIEVGQYEPEALLWKTESGITNSAGNLALHLVGNLNHFLGAVLGGSGYVRDRDAEFTSATLSKDDLIIQIDKAAEVVASVLTNLSSEELSQTYPLEVFGYPMTTEYFLIHLATHLNYHLGQIKYHRRLIAT